MSNKLYVGNLPYHITEDEIKELFESCGEVASIIIVTDKDTGRARGFGFVEMADETGKNKAISKLSNSTLGGRTLKVSEASEKDSPGSSSPKTKNLGTDFCILCDTETTVYGYEDGKGVCATCISSLSRSSKPTRQDYSYSGASNKKNNYSHRY